MIKVRAYFSDGVSKEFDTYLPLTEDIIYKISCEYHGLDYAVLETHLDENKKILVEKYINDSYDLIGLNEFAVKALEWGEQELEEFIKNNIL